MNKRVEYLINEIDIISVESYIAEIKYEEVEHICDTEYNGLCSKCPCGICYENFSNPVKIKCGHLFDKKCIRHYVLYNYYNNNNILCPTCRENISLEKS